MRISIAACYCAIALFIPTTSGEEFRDFRVTIIAITKFQDPELQDEQLNKANFEAANSLKTYFDSKFKVEAQLYTVPEETSSDFLREWLFTDLRRDSRRGVHLIFLLTHGFGYKTAEPDVNMKELFLATSDTYKAKYLQRAIPGSQFIEAFKLMPPRATVFLFLDSCGSGSIDSDNLQKVLEHEPEFGSRVLIVAAANSDESAYGARFTKALVNVWQADKPLRHCGPNKIATFLTGALRAVPNVSTDVKQTVRVVAPLSPDFCIEEFNYTQRMLLLYNASRGDISVSLQANDVEDSEPSILIKQNQMAPVNVRPTTYTMVAKRESTGDGQDNIVKSINMEPEPAKVEVLFSSDPLDQADASQAAVRYLQSRELFASTSLKLERFNEELVKNLSNTLDSQMQEISSKASVMAQVVAVADADLASHRAQLERARKEREVASLQLSQCGGRFPSAVATCRSTLSNLGKLDSDIENASAVYADFEKRDQLQHERVAEVRLQQAEITRRALKLEDLMKGKAEHDKTWADATAFTQSIAKELRSLFTGVHETLRGVTVSLSGFHPDNDLLLKFVGVVNKYSALQIEIEVKQFGKNSLEEQVAVRHRATALKQELWKMGLQSSSIVARGFITRDRAAAVDLIVSAPRDF